MLQSGVIKNLDYVSTIFSYFELLVYAFESERKSTCATNFIHPFFTRFANIDSMIIPNTNLKKKQKPRSAKSENMWFNTFYGYWWD